MFTKKTIVFLMGNGWGYFNLFKSAALYNPRSFILFLFKVCPSFLLSFNNEISKISSFIAEHNAEKILLKFSIVPIQFFHLKVLFLYFFVLLFDTMTSLQLLYLNMFMPLKSNSVNEAPTLLERVEGVAGPHSSPFISVVDKPPL